MTGGAPSGAAGPAPSDRRESLAQYTGALFFSVSLGITLVAYPLFVVGEGRSKTVAGVLIGLSAAVQVLTRWQLGALMRVVSNANVISAAAVLKCAAVGLLVLSPGMAALVVSAALQGMARAFFWTGNQVQIVRSSRPTPKAIATLNMTATIGMLIGPALGGFIA
ncbi:MAG: MFS transporter, partial [Acidimicrobiaceae bacterium]|nr:MFS transporter [Acidimicrobiaceae bacterium]